MSVIVLSVNGLQTQWRRSVGIKMAVSCKTKCVLQPSHSWAPILKKVYEHFKTHTRVFLAALSLRAKTRNNLVFSERWLDACPVGWVSATRRRDPCFHAAVWMDLKVTSLSKKKVNLKGLQTIWFHPYSLFEMGKSQRWRTDELLAGVGLGKAMGMMGYLRDAGGGSGSVSWLRWWSQGWAPVKNCTHTSSRAKLVKSKESWWITPCSFPPCDTILRLCKVSSLGSWMKGVQSLSVTAAWEWQWQWSSCKCLKSYKKANF